MRTASSLLILLALLPPALAQAGGSSGGRSATVFGQGPEIHLLPNVGRVGTRVQVVGLGYRPGAHVDLLYGAPNASFLPQPLVTATVTANGSFHTSFVVSCAFVVLRASNTHHPPRHCSLSPPNRAIIVGGFVDHRFIHKRTATEGFIVAG